MHFAKFGSSRHANSCPYRSWTFHNLFSYLEIFPIFFFILDRLPVLGFEANQYFYFSILKYVLAHIDWVNLIYFSNFFSTVRSLSLHRLLRSLLFERGGFEWAFEGMFGISDRVLLGVYLESATLFKIYFDSFCDI